MPTETQAAFARRIKRDPAHVTRLKKAGRLVMDGKRVDVDASLKRIQATESPLARDQATRERFAAQSATQAAEQAKNADGVDVKSDLETIGLEMKRHQAAKLAAEAEISQMERDQMAGKLVDAGEVRAAGIEAGNLVRSKFEALPDRYAPELAAAGDANAVHAILAEAVELALTDIARGVETLLKAASE